MFAWKDRWLAGVQALERRAAAICLGGLGATAVLMGAAMWTYPGGTWDERSRWGHAFWGNFWCDLLRAEALNGYPNPVASQLALGALLALAGSLLAYWVVVARFLVPARASSWVWGLGWLGSAGIAVVALTPSDRFPVLHAAAVVATGPAFLIAVFLASVHWWRSRGRLRFLSVLAISGFLLALVNLVQYARQIYCAAEYAWWLPGVQKASTLCFVLWMGMVSAAAPARRESLALASRRR